MNTHVTVADLIRDAIREKIRQDTPELYNHLFENPHNESK